MKRSLGVYVHIPFCNAKCAYCDFVSGVYGDEVKSRYFSELKKEIAAFDFSGYTIDSVYFGGGTPSSVAPHEIAGIMQTLTEHAVFSSAPEVTVECNPESLTAEKCAVYRNCGVNRLSIGLQSATDRLLAGIGRIHTVSDFIASLDAAEKYFDNLSADLMLGLPGQTSDDVRRAVCLLVGRNLKHISAYALSVENGTPLAKSGFTANEDVSADLYAQATEMLSESGYRRYEVSNFAFPGYECRHNMRYWTRGEYRGFGVAAHSFVGDVRTENTPDLGAYLRGTRTVARSPIEPHGREAADETLMLALRTADGLDLGAYLRKFGIDILRDKADRLALLRDYVEVADGRLRLTDRGYYVMNEIIVRLAE